MSSYEKGVSPAVSRALTVLDLLARSRRGLSVSELSRMLELPKSSTHHILAALRGGGCVIRDHDHRYRFGFRLLSLARMALQNSLLREVARPILVSLVRATGLTVHMGVLDSAQAVIIEKVNSPGPVQVGTWVGRTLDIHSTSLGKALVAFLTDQEFDREVGAKGFIQHNQKTIYTRHRLKREFLQIGELGYTVDDEEDEVGMRCVGAPIFDNAGRAVAAVSVAGTTIQIPTEKIAYLGQTVRQFAAGISSSLAARQEIDTAQY